MAETHGYHDNKPAYLARLRRIEGQVRGLQRMVDEDVYCIDILTQVSAVNKALQSVAVGLVEDHLGHCVRDAVARGRRPRPTRRWPRPPPPSPACSAPDVRRTTRRVNRDQRHAAGDVRRDRDDLRPLRRGGDRGGVRDPGRHRRRGERRDRRGCRRGAAASPTSRSGRPSTRPATRWPDVVLTPGTRRPAHSRRPAGRRDDLCLLRRTRREEAQPARRGDRDRQPGNGVRVGRLRPGAGRRRPAREHGADHRLHRRASPSEESARPLRRGGAGSRATTGAGCWSPRR